MSDEAQNLPFDWHSDITTNIGIMTSLVNVSRSDEYLCSVHTKFSRQFDSVKLQKVKSMGIEHVPSPCL